MRLSPTWATWNDTPPTVVHSFLDHGFSYGLGGRIDMNHHIEILEVTPHHQYRVAINGHEPLQERVYKGKTTIGPKWFSNPLSQVANEAIASGQTEGFVYLWDDNPKRWRARINIATLIKLEEEREKKRVDSRN